MMKAKQAIAVILVGSTLSLSVQAADLSGLSAGSGLALSHELSGAQAGAEYVSGNYPGAVLMPINLWGAVQRPGIHHIPTQTDLVTLISLAGGPGPDAQIDEILIKRRSAGEEQVIKVNANDILTKPGVRSPVLEANDIVIVPAAKPAISNSAYAVATFVATLLTVVLAGFAINSNLKNK